MVETVDELLPNTIKNLRGNLYEQTWILGDVVSDALQSLLDSGVDAPVHAADTYWAALHLLVRDEIIWTSRHAISCVAGAQQLMDTPCRPTCSNQ